jgi:hypothetical protein
VFFELGKISKIEMTSWKKRWLSSTTTTAAAATFLFYL